MKRIDATGSPLSSGLFAMAYNSVIPDMADARHVTVVIHPNRLSELRKYEQDASDVIEIGPDVIVSPIDQAQKRVERIIAVPVHIHPKDGAEIMQDTMSDPTQVLFCVNGIPEVVIVNLAISKAEQMAIDQSQARAAADEKAMAEKQDSNELEAAKKEAFEEGKKQALLEQAKEAGKASVVKGSGTVQ